MPPEMTVSLENDLLLLTGASGQQCSHLLPLLYGKWKKLRLVVNSESSEKRLNQKYPEAEVTRADLSNPNETQRILKDVTAVFHIGPGFHPHETEIGYNMIDAAINEAKSGRFQHFVYSSVLNSQLRKLLNHDCKRYVEEYLIESELNYTILQPTHFMEMFPIAMLAGQDEPVYKANWEPSIPFSYLALRDLGAAAQNVLEQREKHYLAQYALVSDGPLPYSEVVEIASKGIGKGIKIETQTLEQAVGSLMNVIFGGTSVPPATRDGLQRMLLYYNHHGLNGNRNVLAWLIGREPTSYKEWISIKLNEAKEK